MKQRDCAAWWIVVAIVLTLSAWTRAAASADVDELIREGVALRRKGDDLGALQRFQQAYQVNQSPRAMAQIALAEQALGRWPMAYEHLNGALAAPNDPWIKKNRPLMTDALDRVNEHVGLIEILGGTAGAEVRIGGTPRGKLPLGRPLAESTGTLIIDLVAPGFVTVQRTTVVRARETTREWFDELAPLARSEAAPAGGSKAGGTSARSGSDATRADVTTLEPRAPTDVAVEGAASSDAARNSQNQNASQGGSLRTKAKWVAWGVGAAALGVGIFGGVRQNQAGSDFSGGCRLDAQQNVIVPAGSTKTAAACRDLKDQVDSNFRLEMIGFVGAGVLAATGLVLWLTEPAGLGSETAGLVCSPGLTGGHGPWLGCNLRF